MNSTLYMEKAALQPTSSFTSESTYYSNLTIALSILSIFFNLFTFYLVKRQGFKTFDMWMASFLTIGDAIFVTYKLCQAVAFNIIGIGKIFLNVNYGQYDGLIEVSFVFFSVSCVGFLALLRYWALCLKRKLKIWIWAAVFVFLQFFHLAILIGVFVNKDFILMPFQRYYYPNALSVVFITRFTACYMLILCSVCLVLVDFCYTSLAKRFACLLENNRNSELNDSFYNLNSSVKKQKRSTYIRTGIILLLYNISVGPFVVIGIKRTDIDPAKKQY
ncbi:hypothetical protein K502DRAFT_351805 [Neoconidiobolus thromboides FSU 785]|nr:hypothetical protein K502DRAFT_351805 [Neoconidiobolus thromboides FSU 785]